MDVPQAYPRRYVEDTSEPRTKLAAVFDILLVRQTLDLLHRPHLHGADSRARNPCGDTDRISLVLGVNKKVPRELLARFHEGPVGHERFAVTDLDDGRRRRADAAAMRSHTVPWHEAHG